MNIGDFDINKQVFIIAELSANHGNDINIAKNTIRLMKESGADAVKLQTYTPDTITLNSTKSYFQINQGTLWDGKILYDLYKEAFLPWEWHKELFDYAKSIGMIIFSTPFDKTAVDLLEDLNVPAYKIASFEITDIPLIEYVASKQKPVIISTGIGSLEEIHEAVEACRKQGNDNIILLKCTSSYPAKIEDANLNTMVDMKERFGVEIGLSDHSIGNFVPIIATSMGAKIIEKHFILDKSIGGPDAEFSMNPKEFKEMVESIRKVESCVGVVDYEIDEKKMNNRKFSRSLFISKSIGKGEVITEEHIRSVRPSDGIKPKHYKEIIGRKAKVNVDFGEPLKWEVIE